MLNLIAIRAVCCLVIFGAISYSPAPAGAQTLEHAAEFWAFNDVQFLPGGYVEEENQGSVERFLYRGSKFEPFKGEAPALIRGWSAFDWQVDYLDQIDATERINVDLRPLVPRRVKVKKAYEIELPGTNGAIALICYTRKLRIIGSNTQDIYVTAAVNTNSHDTRSEYRRLWTRKLRSETNYGDFQYQLIPGSGAFFLLYSEVIGGDAVEHHLDVYRMKALEGSDKPRRHGSHEYSAVKP